MKTNFGGVPQILYQGSGCIKEIPDILQSEGWKRVMIVADPGVDKAGMIKQFEDILEGAGVPFCKYTDIRPNPRAIDVETKAMPMFREFKADVLLAIGGGSAMDTAKGMALIGETNLIVKEAMAASPGIHKPMPHKTLPMIAVPTTCGTGSECTANAVLSDEVDYKMVPMQDAILPKYAVCDPDLLATLPQHVAADTAMDAYVQAVESYVSKAATPLSELFSMAAIELIAPAIRPYYADRSNPKWADMISKGCMYAGIAWNLSLPAQIHCSCHAITQYLHITHGASCAILFPAFAEFNGYVCEEKFRKVYKLMRPGADMSEYRPEWLVEELKRLNKDLNIMNGETMADVCARVLPDENIDDVVRYKIMAPFGEVRPGYPRTTKKEEWIQIMTRVAHGEYM